MARQTSFRRGSRTQQTIMMHHPGGPPGGQLAGVMLDPMLTQAAVAALNTTGYQPATAAHTAPVTPEVDSAWFRPDTRTGMTLFAHRRNPVGQADHDGALVGLLFNPQLAGAAAAALNRHHRLGGDPQLREQLARELCALQQMPRAETHRPWGHTEHPGRQLYRIQAGGLLDVIDNYLQGMVR